MIDEELLQLYEAWRSKIGSHAAAGALAAAQWTAARNCCQAVDDDAPLKPGDVAKQLKASIHTVLDWIRTNQLKASNLATGSRPRYVIQRVDLDRFLASRQPEPPARRRRAG